MINSWVKDYIGIPFNACNCWQLICRIYRDRLKIELPYLDDRYADPYDKGAISEIYTAELARVWQRTESPAEYSAVVFNIQGQPWHVGCVVAKNTMLHTHDRIDSCVERFNTSIWQHRIEGYYNYKKDAGCKL